jgi:hypothetical protein
VKKLNVVFLILIFAVSLIMYSCSASAGVTVGKQQSNQTVKVIK